MKSVTYIAEDKTDLGRFGVVSKGTTIKVNEQEFQGIKGDPRFKVVPPKLTEEDRVAASVAKPYGTPAFDLRTIPWFKPNLFRILESRFSKNRISVIAGAMRTVGAPVRETSEHDIRTALVDSVVEAADLCGWTAMTAGAIASLPLHSEVKAKPSGTKPEAKPTPDTDTPTSAPAIRKRKRRRPSTKN
jgi:hypothetical protein